MESLQQNAEVLLEQYSVIRKTMSELRLNRYELCLLTIRKVCHDILQWAKEPTPLFWCLAAIVSLVVVLAIDETIGRVFSPSRRLGIPIVKRPIGAHRWDYEAILDKAAQEHPKSPFTIAYSGYEFIVYPSSFFDEVKRLPSSQASMLDYFTHVFFQGWRFLGSDASTLYKTIGIDLNRAIPDYVHGRQDDAEVAVAEALGSCVQEKSVPLFATCQNIVAITNARGLVGPELGADPRWTTAVQRFPMAIMIAVFASHAVPRVLRPLVAVPFFLPAWILYWYMQWLLHPTITKALQQRENGQGEDQSPSSYQGFPIVSWLMKRYKQEEQTAQQIIHDLIAASFESTASMAGTLYFILAELSLRPELVCELRQEILDHTDKNGRLPLTQLDELKKLDSVMRESSRVNPFSSRKSLFSLRPLET
jgi:hypothetical protein